MCINNEMSVSAIQEQIGVRLKRARLNKNLTQSEVADQSGLTKFVVGQVEKGASSVESLIRYLSALDMVDHLNDFVPPTEVLPVQLSKLSGNVRQRASRVTRKQNEAKDMPEKDGTD